MGTIIALAIGALVFTAIAPFLIFIFIICIIFFVIAGAFSDAKPSKYSQMTPRERLEFKFAYNELSYEEYLREKARLDIEEGSALPKYKAPYSTADVERIIRNVENSTKRSEECQKKNG